MNLKKFLKFIKLHEQAIGIIFGILILVITGIFVIKYIKNLTNNPPSQTKQTQNQSIKHVIVKGETLWSISKKYYNDGSNWKKIADANKVSDPTRIEIGQSLTIPDVSPSPAVEVKTPSPVPSPQISKEAAATSSEITTDSYIVVKGDNLWNIAVRAYGDGTKWHQIAEANKLKNPRLIHRGNVFIIPR